MSARTAITVGAEQEAFERYLTRTARPPRGRYRGTASAAFDAGWIAAIGFIDHWREQGENVLTTELTGEAATRASELREQGAQHAKDAELIEKLISSYEGAQEDALWKGRDVAVFRELLEGEREKREQAERAVRLNEARERDTALTIGRAVLTLTAARRAHTEAGGSCTVCGTAWPCQVLELVGEVLPAGMAAVHEGE